MKQIASTYTYNKTSGVISLTGVNIDRDQLLLVVNTTRNVTYYNFADSATTLQAFTQGANTSLTLNSSVIAASSAHANGDALTIYYDDQVSTVTANLGNVAGTPLDNPPSHAVRIAWADEDALRGAGVDNGGEPLPIQIYLGNSSADNVTTANPLPISGTVTALDLGAMADAVATADTGTFSVISLIKRGLQNWTSLLAKIPTLVSNRIPVDGSGVTQPVSLASVPSHAVTGTFWQTTQPVSGPLTDTQLRATAVSVSTIPSQGTTVTNSNFTSVTPSTSLVSAVAGRKVLTVYNEGAGVIYISGGATCTTASYQIRLGVGEYWECPEGQASLAHSAVFATAGTARVTQVS
jgi:hypothetical protein